MDAWVDHKDTFYGDLQDDEREGGICQLRTVRLWGTHGLSGRGTWVRHDDQMQGSSPPESGSQGSGCLIETPRDVRIFLSSAGLDRVGARDSREEPSGREILGANDGRNGMALVVEVDGGEGGMEWEVPSFGDWGRGEPGKG